ncbi:methyltransferase domain-containing protein [bacterium]|nr:methyltransferase domain-containing protein [bacterium]
MSETLFDYYARQGVLPTYGGLRTREAFAAHERARRRLFTGKLGLPPSAFRGARLLEFGPDAGENSLVFAAWGANLMLAEPNTKAHPVIQDYFRQFDLTSRLSAIEPSSVTSFPVLPETEHGFDVIDAEGFIYTIQPTSLWIEKFARLVREDGVVILFYYEPYGCFLELFLKVVHGRYQRLAGVSSVEAAHRCFDAKWAAIPHKRSIESWVMDVLENPFVRLRYFLEARKLIEDMADAGFELYSSWPRYDNGLDVFWFKRELAPEDRLRRQAEFVSCSRLSHFFGRKHFLFEVEQRIERELWGLLEDMDALVENFECDRAKRCRERLGVVRDRLRSDGIISDAADTARSLETIGSVDRLLLLLERGEPPAIEAFCARDHAFIESWGLPSHFAIFWKAR